MQPKILDQLNQQIDNAITNLKFDLAPISLYDPIIYILKIGGKRIRPLLTLLANNIFSDDIHTSLAPALGIEVFHNFTLLHDDLMDKSDIRRGMPTVHKKWDANTAILSGDAMLIEAYKLIADVPKDKLPTILALFSDTALKVCQGQQYDMDFEKEEQISVSDYLLMIKLKTAVLIACALKTGAIMGEASDNNAELLYEYGINIGIAFQLKDDFLDVYGDPKIFGKNIGGDIKNNKKTFLLTKAFEKANDSQRLRLTNCLKSETIDPDKKVDEVKKLYEELNVLQATEDMIKNYYLAALNALEKIDVAKTKKSHLKYIAEQLMNREK